MIHLALNAEKTNLNSAMGSKVALWRVRNGNVY